MKFLSTVALAALLSVAPSVAHAQDDDAEVTRMAKEHYKAGLEAYKAGKFDVAIKELKKAYLLKRLPALLLNIGATYRKMGDLDLATHFYKKYLDEAPPEARDRGEVEATIKEIAQEKEGGGAKPAEEPAPEPTPPPSRPKEESAPPAKEWSHTPVDAAPPDTPLDVRVSTPVMKGVKVFLFYRGSGEENFNSVLMKRHGAEKIGRIPPKAMQGKAIQYYIEARDGAGTVVKSSGSQASPNVIMIDPSAPVQMLASAEEMRERESAPVESREEATPSRSSDDEEAPIMGHVNEPRGKRTRESRRSGAPSGPVSPLTIAGATVLAVGIAGIGVGIAGLLIAQQKASTLTSDAMHDPNAPGPIDGNGNKIYFNNDPNAGSQQEAQLQADGKLWNTIGIAMTVVGSVATVAGIALLVSDAVLKGGGSADKPKKKKHRRSSDEDSASIEKLYVAPSVGPKFAGVGAGFAF
jgi:hypothetical protein